jgi:hypothetical protein
VLDEAARVEVMGGRRRLRVLLAGGMWVFRLGRFRVIAPKYSMKNIYAPVV